MIESIEAAIRISSSSISAAQIGALLGVRGSRLVNPKLPQSDARLIVDSSLSKSEPLERHLSHLCDQLEAIQSALKALPEDTEIDIWCVAYSNNEFAGFGLDGHLMERLSRIPTSLVFSIYAASGEQRDVAVGEN